MGRLWEKVRHDVGTWSESAVCTESGFFLHKCLLRVFSYSPSAEEILNKYLKSVGGREAILGEDAQKKEPKIKKRGRTSTATSTPDNKPNGKKPRKNITHPASTTPPASLEKAAFKPPTGSWEDEVQGIDACEGTDGNVMVFLQWASGHKTQHPLEQVYKRCPQKVYVTAKAYHNAILIIGF